MADKQSREENQCIHCGNQYREENSKPFSEVGKLLEESGDKMGASLLRLSVDVSEALKGLKALQREARSTTKALKELEGKKATMTIVDEMNGLCPKCNSHITTEDVYSLGCEQPLEQSRYCTECGWKYNV